MSERMKLEWTEFGAGARVSGFHAAHKGRTLWVIEDRQFNEWRLEMGDKHGVEFELPAQSEAHAKAAAEAFTKVLDALRDEK